MALKQLTDEQIANWTRLQKDQWWYENVYRGDMPQLTVRAAITGFLLGGVLSATALYIAGKTGITIGVGLTSVILAFAMFRIMSRSGIIKDFTILENNCTQSIATASGYMVTPIVSGLAAYMMVTNTIVPWWKLVIFNVVISSIGVLVAFPMKRRFINEDQLPFPEGRAAGVVLDALYTGEAAAGMFKAKLLAVTAVFTGLYQFISSDGWMKLLQFKILRMDKWAGMTAPWHFQERFDTYYYNAAAKFNLWIPKIMGTDVRQLGLRLTLDAAMLGVGGLMGIRVATSVLLGALVNFAILAPIMIQRGDIKSYTAPSGALVAISRPEIVNQWALWWGVTMMVVGALVGLFAKPEIFTKAFTSLTKKKEPSTPATDPLRHIEVPLWVSFVGVPLLSILGAYITHEYFGVRWLLAFISLPLIFILTVISTNSMALTSWTPTGALSKITQFTMGAIDRVNPATNLIPGHDDRRDLVERVEPAVGHQAGIHVRRQAATAGGRALHRDPGRDAGDRAVVLPVVPPAGTRRCALTEHDHLRTVCNAGGGAVERRGRPDHERLESVANVGGHLDGCRRDSCAGVRGPSHSHQGWFPPVSGVDRPGRGAAAGVVRRDVGRRDDLLVQGSPETSAGLP
jgi:hypothetical protein